MSEAKQLLLKLEALVDDLQAEVVGLRDEIRDCRERPHGMQNMNNAWIRTADRIPLEEAGDYKHGVWAWDEECPEESAYFIPNDHAVGMDVSHWMPAVPPEPPTHATAYERVKCDLTPMMREAIARSRDMIDGSGSASEPVGVLTRSGFFTEDEIDDLRAEAVGLKSELRAWRSLFPSMRYIALGGVIVGPYYRFPCGMFESIGGPWQVFKYRTMPCTPAGDLVSEWQTKEEADAEVERLNAEDAAVYAERLKHL